MTLIDRYIIRRFLINFVILFVLIYVLATAIDMILQLDEFMRAVYAHTSDEAGLVERSWILLRFVIDFYGPRIFQLYAYLLGLISVGAMGFTLAQMHRHRELTALLASGMSLYRVGWPILLAAFALNMLHLVNSNVLLPRFAPLLIREHGDLIEGDVEAFAVPLTRDGEGALLQAAAFHLETRNLDSPTILVLDEQGLTSRHITASGATWDEQQGAWLLEDGIVYERIEQTERTRGEVDVRSSPIASFRTSLGPQALIVRRYTAFAQMLSPSQIDEMLASPGAIDAERIARIKYGRYSTVFANLLMLLLVIPFFLLREPANLLNKSVMCAGASLGVMIGAFIGMEISLPGIPPVASVFLPVVVLVPLTLFSLSFVRT